MRRNDIYSSITVYSLQIRTKVNISWIKRKDFDQKNRIQINTNYQEIYRKKYLLCTKMLLFTYNLTCCMNSGPWVFDELHKFQLEASYWVVTIGQTIFALFNFLQDTQSNFRQSGRVYIYIYIISLGVS